MLYMGDKLQYWEGNAHFAPAGTDIEFFVDGTSDDNMDDQHQFFEHVRDNWSQWSVPILEKVRLECQPDAKDDVQISSMNLPKSQFTENTQWQVSFSAKPSGNLYTVHMRGAKPESVEYDS